MVSIRGLRLYFQALELWVAWSALLPTVRPGLSMRECGAIGCHLPHCLPCSPPLLSPALSVYLCESPVSVPPRPRESSLPRLPVSAPPTGLDECLFFISLVLDFLAIRFSVSSGCARRCSVSTYASILVLPLLLFFLYCDKDTSQKHSTPLLTQPPQNYN